MWLDLRYAFRVMAKAPGLTGVLVLTLALGIGASTTIFSVMHSVLLRPLPYPEPDRLVRIYTEAAGGGEPRVERQPLSGPEYLDLVRDCRSCEAVGAWNPGMMTIGGADRPAYVETSLATHTMLPLLGTRPLIGRWFDASEDPKGKARPDRPAIVLGYDLWQRVFDGDPSVVGRTITLEGFPIIVVGVMPPGFGFPDRVEAWIPFGRDHQSGRRADHHLSVMVRLKAGVAIEAFRDELAALSAQWGALEAPDYHAITPDNPWVRSHPMVAVSYHTDVVGSLSTTLWLLQGAALLVLLISIVNVANLLLARAQGRTREVAVRHALGASRRRLVRQFLTESLVLGTIGGGLGILVAMWGVDGVTSLIPRSAPRASEIALDGAAVAFAVACSFAASLLFGLAPILHARATDVHGALKDGSPRMTGTKARLRVRQSLVVGEIALAVVLVIGCTVMVRAFVRLQRVDLGFQPDHLLSLKVRLPYASFPGLAPDLFWQRALDRLRALPGATGVTLVDYVPGSLPRSGAPIEIARGFNLVGLVEPPGEPWKVRHQIVGDHFVATIGARLVAGRDLLPSDSGDAPPVCLINEAFARRWFPGEDPIGKRIELMTPRPPLPAYQTVVGVVADLKQNRVDAPAGTEAFLPMRQYVQIGAKPSGKSHCHILVRTRDDPASYASVVLRAIADLDPAAAVANVRTMDDVLWEAIARPRFLTFLLACFAGLALLLAAVGIYGVMAHTVAQRTHEIGLRVALGAQPAHVRAMILRDAGALVAIGVAGGLAAVACLELALDASRLFHGESAFHPVLLGCVALVVALAALVATWLPARRATSVEPSVALRIE